MIIITSAAKPCFTGPFMADWHPSPPLPPQHPQHRHKIYMAHNWLLPGWSLMKFVTMMIHENGQFSQFSSRFQILSPRRRVCFARGRDLLQRGPRARREVSLLCNMFVCNDFLLKTGLCIKVSCVICIFNIHSHYAYLLDICYTVRCTFVIGS